MTHVLTVPQYTPNMNVLIFYKITIAQNVRLIASFDTSAKPFIKAPSAKAETANRNIATATSTLSPSNKNRVVV